MPKLRAAALAALLLCLCGSSPASAYDCTPYCDFNHDYGPYDFTYLHSPYAYEHFYPGLVLFPQCGPSGNCSPQLVRSWPRYRGVVTVRPFVRRTVPRP